MKELILTVLVNGLKEKFTINNISSKARYLVDSHEFSIAIKYSFGKIKSTEFKEKNIDDNSNRVR